MKGITSFVIIAFVAVFFSGCSTIQTYENIRPNVGGPYKAVVGSKLYSITITQDLPNAFGKADLFGGKINKGKKELVYLGMDDSGFLIFNLYEVEIVSTETTMSRYSNSTAISASTYYSGSFSNTDITIREPPTSYTFQLPPNSRTFGFDPEELKVFSMDGIVIELHEYSNNYIIYSISKDGIY